MKTSLKQIAFLAVVSLILAACAPLNPIGLLEKVLPGQDADAASQLESEPPDTAPPALKETSPNNQIDQGTTGPDGTVEALEDVYAQIYALVNPSVVNIQVQRVVKVGDSPMFEFMERQDIPQERLQRGLGSGFVWDKQGHIVTNNHVILNADKITVNFANGLSMKAEVVGRDANSDLAVIKVDADADLLSPVNMAESAGLKVGQMAVAIGNPFGLEGSMTVGIISAIGRSLPVNAAGLAATSSSYVIPDIIQTDAPINPGNSGGVLVNNEGAVIGVTTAIQSTDGSNSGIGFAVPSGQVLRVVPVLIREGKYEYTYLGISGQTISTELAKEMGLDDRQQGVLVGEVTKGGPADKAGVRGSSREVNIDGSPARIGGDVIVKIDDENVNRFEDLVSYLARETSVGQTVSLTILREMKEQVVDVKLEARPAPTPLAGALPAIPEAGPRVKPEIPQAPLAGSTWLGVSGSDLTPDLARALELDPSTNGVEIIAVSEGSPAAEAGLQGRSPTRAGDIITTFDGQKVTDMSNLRELVLTKKSGDVVKLLVIRDGKEIAFDVTMAERK